MMASLLLFIGLVIAFFGGLLFSKKTSGEASKVLDLTAKIQDNQKKSIITQADADKKVQEYQDALKKLDPNFHNDDDGGNKPAS